MNALTCVIASDDDVDAASAQTGKKEHVRSDRMSSDADAADAQNIEKTSLPYLLCKYGRPRRRIACLPAGQACNGRSRKNNCRFAAENDR